jgi:ubiquinone/menaquinone biosynthesis C-methylase UbiE
MDKPDRYIPALGFGWLTSLYDPVVRWTTREETFKSELLRQADLRPGDQVLDVGCGTGTLAIAAARLKPAAHVTGLDGDQKILAIANRKAARAGVPIELQHAMSDAMPFPDARFSVVLSSLFFHHLTSETKRDTLGEIARVLRPGGRLHVADWGAPQNPAMRMAFQAIRLLDGYETTADAVAGRLPALIAEAGFARVRHTRNFATVFGTMALYSCLKPN